MSFQDHQTGNNHTYINEKPKSKFSGDGSIERNPSEVEFVMDIGKMPSVPAKSAKAKNEDCMYMDEEK